MRSFAQYELIKTRRKTGNMVYKYFSVLSYHLERLLANFNIAETLIFICFQYCLDEVIS